MNAAKLSLSSKIVLLISAILFVGSIFFPVWRIELDAPQYPEGLALEIWANKIGGDVEIINGLNHYIGMKTLHTEDFIEFTLLPYIISFFALICLSVIFINRKKALLILLVGFVCFGVFSMIDFYRWNYNYGHNLDPNAAIKVPGMAYQPPLIGYKQLLNFGAYSIPDIGGLLMIAAGSLLLLITILEYNMIAKFISRKKNQLVSILSLFFFLSCHYQPESIKLNYDKCVFCKMTIVDGRFAAALLSDKGKTYKFDDISCLVKYMKANKNIKYQGLYISDYTKIDAQLIEVQKAVFIESEALKSPMRGDIAAFSREEDAQSYLQKLNAKKITWAEIMEKF